MLQRQLRSRTTPHTRLAIKNKLFILRRLLEAKPVLEFLRRKEDGVGLRGDGHVDGGWDEAFGVFVWLADVDEDGVFFWGVDERFNLQEARCGLVHVR